MMQELLCIDDINHFYQFMKAHGWKSLKISADPEKIGTLEGFALAVSSDGVSFEDMIIGVSPTLHE